MIKYPLRVNISYLLDDHVGLYVRAVNARIQEQEGSEISFQPQGSAIPHITMLMGNVNSAADMNLLEHRVRRFVQGIERVTYSLTAPHPADTARRYIFCGVEAAGILADQRLRLFRAMGPLISLEKNGGPRNSSHVTLGYLRLGVTESVLARERAIFESFEPATGVTRSVQIALAGPRGTCIETLWSGGVGGERTRPADRRELLVAN